MSFIGPAPLSLLSLTFGLVLGACTPIILNSINKNNLFLKLLPNLIGLGHVGDN